MSTIAFKPYVYPVGYPESFKIPEELQLEAYKTSVENTTKSCYELIVNATRNKQYRIFINSAAGVGNPGDLDTETLKEMIPGITFRYDKYANAYSFSWPITFLFDMMSKLSKPILISEEERDEMLNANIYTKNCYQIIIKATKHKQYRVSLGPGSGIGNPEELDTDTLKKIIPGITFYYDKWSNTYTISWSVAFLV